jgi:hypothetical protein
VVSQLASIFLCALLAALVLRQKGRAVVPLMISILLCGMGYVAAAVTMGLGPQMKLLPFLVVVAVLLRDELVPGSDPAATSQDRHLLKLLPILLAYTFILPALATAADGFIKSIRFSDAALVSEGPLSGYFVEGGATSVSGLAVATAELRLAAAVAQTSRRLAAGDFHESDEYVAYSEGVSLLQQIPDIASYGIVSNGRMFDFTMPLGAEVVPSYPVWPVKGLPGLANRDRLGTDVDLVMMLVEVPKLGLVSEDLFMLMGDDFRPCRRSTLWTLYARHAHHARLCPQLDSKVQSGGAP